MPALKSEKRELFAQGLSRGLTKAQAALNAGFSEKSCTVEGSRLAKHPDVVSRVGELFAKVAEAKAKVATDAFESALVEVSGGKLGRAVVTAVATAIRDRQYRITILQDVVDRIRMLVDERAAHGRALPEDQKAPGVETGLLVRKQKNVRRGKKIVVIDEWAFDGVVLSELRDTLKHAAVEVGDWEEKHQVKQTEGPDVSHLTDEQLFAEQKVLREARAKIEAIHAGQPQPLMLDAAVGSVEDLDDAVLQPVVQSADAIPCITDTNS